MNEDDVEVLIDENKDMTVIGSNNEKYILEGI